MDEFKAMFKEQGDGRFKEKKPLVTTPRSDKGGDKLDLTIFMRNEGFFKVFQTCKAFFRYFFKVDRIHRFACFIFSS
jgi:hypothetical protein